jgi:hypothetical protein
MRQSNYRAGRTASIASRVGAGDRWLFLTPEPESVLPAAVAALAAALGEEQAHADEEAERLEGIVTDGRFGDWLGYLRARRALLERYVERFGPDPLASHVAGVLENHYLLALSLPGDDPALDDERRRVSALARRLAAAAP